MTSLPTPSPTGEGAISHDTMRPMFSISVSTRKNCIKRIALIAPNIGRTAYYLSSHIGMEPTGVLFMTDFQVVAPFQPTGDQPEAITALEDSLRAGNRYQTLLGVTGSGKTFTVAELVERVEKPTLVLAPNKTLAAQLYAEYKELFPANAVEYFVSYYDYYQPEAYIPRTDTYVEKED